MPDHRHHGGRGLCNLDKVDPHRGPESIWLSFICFLDFFRDGKNFSGNFVVDEEILKEEGMKDFAQYAAVPGTTEFLPDFFLDEFDDFQTKKSGSASGGSGGSGGSVQKVFDNLSGLINEEMVGKIQAVYAFDIKGLRRSCHSKYL